MLGHLKPERSKRLSLSLSKLVVRVVRVAPTAWWGGGGGLCPFWACSLETGSSGTASREEV